MPKPFHVFLHNNNVIDKIDEANNNSNNIKSFIKRLFNWFNAFKVIKFLNFCSEKYYPKIDVVVAASIILGKLGIPASDNYDDLDLLELLRNYEKTHLYNN